MLLLGFLGVSWGFLGTAIEIGLLRTVAMSLEIDLFVHFGALM
jgi:hypothetical protein